MFDHDHFCISAQVHHLFSVGAFKLDFRAAWSWQVSSGDHFMQFSSAVYEDHSNRSWLPPISIECADLLGQLRMPAVILPIAMTLWMPLPPHLFQPLSKPSRWAFIRSGGLSTRQIDRVHRRVEALTDPSAVVGQFQCGGPIRQPLPNSGLCVGQV